MLGLDDGELAGAALGAVLAVGFVIAAVRMVLAARRMCAPADGTVIGDEFTGNDFVPVVEFVDADCTRYRFRAENDGYLETGQTIPVAYDPNAPQRARIATPASSYGKPLVRVLLAAIIATLTWTFVGRQTDIAAPGRMSAYLTLDRSLQRLETCALRPCSSTTIQRRLRAYDRARLAAQPIASPPVTTQMAQLQHSLARTRSANARASDTHITALRTALLVDLAEMINDDR